MKSINKFNRSGLATLLVFVLLVSSCKKDFLNLRPYDSVSSDIAISNVSDMRSALSGGYASLQTANLYGRSIPLFADLVADNLYISTTNSNRYSDFFQINYNESNSNAQAMWEDAYAAILRVNNVINSKLEGTAEIDQLRGEALAIRALMYFELIKLFAKPYTVDAGGLGVPVVLTYDPTAKPGRNTTTEVYTQIEADLTKAADLMTEEKTSGFFTKYAVKAMLARIYQFKGEWSKALTAAEDVINNSGYTLLELNDVLSFWQNNTDRDDKLEVLFEVVFDANSTIGNSSLPYFFDQGGYGDAIATDALYDLYAATDVRKDLFIVGSDVRNDPDLKVVNKFPNAGSADKDDMKIIRLSDVYLIAAEAAFQTNDEDKAIDYLNEVATRRDAAFVGYASTGQALLDDILLERRKELAFEGHRYWDIARYNKDVTRINLAQNYPPNVPLSLPVSDFHRILPIPQTELDANPAIREEQNSGY